MVMFSKLLYYGMYWYVSDSNVLVISIHPNEHIIRVCTIFGTGISLELIQIFRFVS